MDISASTVATKKLGVEIQNRATEYQTEVNKVYSEVEELRNAWQGADNQSYVTRVNEHKKDIEDLGKVVKSYGEFLIAAADFIERTQQDVADAAGKL